MQRDVGLAFDPKSGKRKHAHDASEQELEARPDIEQVWTCIERDGNSVVQATGTENHRSPSRAASQDRYPVRITGIG